MKKSGRSGSGVFSAVTIAVIQIIGALVISTVFLVMTFAQFLISLGSAAGRSPAAWLLAGACISGVLLFRGIRTLSLVSRFRKVNRLLEKSGGSISLAELSNATGCPEQKLEVDAQLMAGRNFFPLPVQLDLYRRELITGSEPILQPAAEDGIRYKEISSKGPSIPVCFGLTWIIYLLLFPVTGVGTLVMGAGVSVLVFLLERSWAVPVRRLVEDKKAAKAAAKRPDPVRTGDQEVDSALNTAREHLAEMEALNRTISQVSIQEPVAEMLTVGGSIVEHLMENPQKIRQARQFLNYYLPTTVKLLHSWDEFSRQGVRGDNIRQSMKKIEDMMQDVLRAFRRELDNLYLDRAVDISADIQVMQSMMSREGIGGSDVNGFHC